MSKHTPGPWHQHIRMDGSSEVEAGRTFPVASTTGCIGGTEGHANARLIAAAPELLEALQGTMRTMEMHHGKDCRCKECLSARAAIAKAT